MTFNEPKLAKGIKTRKHHNTKGLKQVRTGKTTDQVIAMAKRLGIPYVTKAKADRKKEKA